MISISWTLSISGTKRLLSVYADQFRQELGEQVCTMVATVMAYILSLQLSHRPLGRIEPRIKNRQSMNIPLFTVLR